MGEMAYRRYLAGELTDFELTVGTSSYRVHKFAFMVISEVFCKMMDGSFVEKEQGRANLVLEEEGEAAFPEIIKYIYTGAIVLDIDNVQNIFLMADQFELMDLRDRCISFMMKSPFITEPGRCRALSWFSLAKCMGLKELQAHLHSFL